jgi:hypothetical protein
VNDRARQQARSAYGWVLLRAPSPVAALLRALARAVRRARRATRRQLQRRDMRQLRARVARVTRIQAFNFATVRLPGTGPVELIDTRGMSSGDLAATAARLAAVRERRAVLLVDTTDLALVRAAGIPYEYVPARPPFLAGRVSREAFSRRHVDEIRRAYGGSVPTTWQLPRS